VNVVAAYVNGLRFGRPTDAGIPIRSPFDIFLEINGLPQQPSTNELPVDYSRRLRTLVNAAGFVPKFVTSNPNSLSGQFDFHPGQSFVFGASELDGLKVFLAEPATIPASPTELAAGRIGNCIACHAAPNFTDFKLHNTGTAQREFDNIHGAGQFAALVIPNLATRNGNFNAYLPATENHPAALGPFRAIPSAGNPGLTDLGVWNIFANPDVPNPQTKIRAILCNDQVPCPLSDATLLDQAIARFKTPGLRDLGHSQPYMHTGQFDTLDSIIQFYLGVSAAARAGTLRNGDTELQGIALTAADVTSLVAFLKSLNEDYQ
jgi:hypothetical protein